jgi:hypothetical protein
MDSIDLAYQRGERVGRVEKFVLGKLVGHYYVESARFTQAEAGGNYVLSIIHLSRKDKVEGGEG